MKDTYYFSHDYNARNDPKLINLQIKHGMEGVGCYWCIVEMLYEQGGEIPLEYERIAFVLRTDVNVIRNVINDFNLFIFDDGILSSESILKRISERSGKSAKARESINKRWEKIRENTNVSKNDTNVPKSDTIKERKVKEIKEKDINTVFEFYPFIEFWNDYDKKIDSKKCQAKWSRISAADRKLIKEYLPKYKLSTPDITFRKHPITFLNNSCWLDAIIPSRSPKLEGIKKPDYNVKDLIFN